MTLTFTAPETDDQLKPRITVVGVGGAGGNAVNNMIVKELDGVDFVVANTDAQAISQSHAERRIQLGRSITHGLGAGARPDMGRAAAEEAIEDIAEFLSGSHMVFIAAGMGGGTGTGAAPVIARLAREQGMLTVGVVTKPFQFEGSNRMRISEAGIEEMQQFVDTLIVIPNQNLFRIANEKTTFADAFAMADDVLHSGVRGVTDLMVVPGLINLDFADIRSVMCEMGKAMMGTGEAEGEERARLAAEAAISNPLLDDVSMKGARGVLINITGGPDMTLFEVDEAANRIGEEVDADANIIFGSALDAALEGQLRVSVVATGIDVNVNTQPRPVLRVLEDPAAKPVVTPTSAATPVALTLPAGLVTTGATAMALEEPVSDLDIPSAQIQMEPIAEKNLVITPGIAEQKPQKLLEPASVEMPQQSELQINAAPSETLTPKSSDELFIPPPPVEPIKSTEDMKAPDPFREAEMLNAAQPNEQKKGPSLFQRMAKSSWNKIQERDGPKLSEKNEKLQSATTSTEPEMPSKPTIEPKPETATQLDQTPAEAPPVDKPPVSSQGTPVASLQNSLPTERAEEDLLDIPAFLRRQAN